MFPTFPILQTVSPVSSLWSLSYRWNRPQNTLGLLNYDRLQVLPRLTTALCPFPDLPSLNQLQLIYLAKTNFLLPWLSLAPNAQEDSEHRFDGPAHYSDLHWDSAQCCPNDPMQKLSVAGTLFHRTGQTKGRSFGFHSQMLLKIHSEPPLYLHLSASEQLLCCGLWHPTWSITSLLCPQLYSSSQTRQECRVVYLLSEPTSSFTATACTQRYKTHTHKHQLSVKVEENPKSLRYYLRDWRAFFKMHWSVGLCSLSWWHLLDKHRQKAGLRPQHSLNTKEAFFPQNIIQDFFKILGLVVLVTVLLTDWFLDPMAYLT